MDKLCQRFHATTAARQWRDIAFCLSLLTLNEKSLRKLLENFPCYADKLAEEQVLCTAGLVPMVTAHPPLLKKPKEKNYLKF